MKPEEFAEKLKKVMEEILDDLGSPESMQTLGEYAADLVRKRTRLGYGVDKPKGSKKKLAPLSEPYVKVRKNKITGPTTPRRSNLTVTGDMLDSLRANVDGQNSVSIGFEEGTHAADKAGWVSKDRPFNNLSKAEYEQIKKRLEEQVKVLLKKLNSKLK